MSHFRIGGGERPILQREWWTSDFTKGWWTSGVVNIWFYTGGGEYLGGECLTIYINCTFIWRLLRITKFVIIIKIMSSIKIIIPGELVCCGSNWTEAPHQPLSSPILLRGNNSDTSANCTHYCMIQHTTYRALWYPMSWYPALPIQSLYCSNIYIIQILNYS